MTDFVDRDSTHLGTDRIATAPTAQALYDNTIAVAEGKEVPTGFAVGLTKLNGGTVSAAATLDIVMTAYTAWRNKLLVLDSVIPATDTAQLLARVSTDGGSTYDTGAGQYRYAFHTQSSAPANTDNGGTDASIALTSGVGGAGGEPGAHVEIKMYNTTRATTNPVVRIESAWNDGTPNTFTRTGTVERLANQDTDAFRVLFSTGNIASANWALYGWN